MEHLACLVVSIRSWERSTREENAKLQDWAQPVFLGLGGAATRKERELYEIESVAEHSTYREPPDTHR